MSAHQSGRPLFRAALLLVCLMAGGPAAAAVLEVTGADGDRLARLNLEDGQEWCLNWNHSVTGGAVADCFEIRNGRMTLTRSYLHDFAAGLGHLPGRGEQVPAADGGYWIEAMDEVLPGNALVLRVGATSVGHRLIADGRIIDLSALAAGRRVILHPASDPPPEQARH